MEIHIAQETHDIAMRTQQIAQKIQMIQEQKVKQWLTDEASPSESLARQQAALRDSFPTTQRLLASEESNEQSIRELWQLLDPEAESALEHHIKQGDPNGPRT